MAEVLAPARLNIEQEFSRGFEGMTAVPVTLGDLLETREAFIAELVGKMPEEHRRFLVSFKRGEPDWKLLGLPHVERLPAIQWRLHNLAKLDREKRQRLMDGLLRALDIEHKNSAAQRDMEPGA
jgi:hypothetical protein